MRHAAAEDVFIAGYLRQFETDTRRFPSELTAVYCLYYGSRFDNATAISLKDALTLEVGDRVDVRTKSDGFWPGTVVLSGGGRVTVSYRKFSECSSRKESFFVRVDCEKELHRLAKHASISGRPRHRLHDLRCGDFVDVNPRGNHDEGCHPGWVHGEVAFVSRRSGQIQVDYEVTDSDDDTIGMSFWSHLDQTAEIAEFGSHTEPISTLFREISSVHLADDADEGDSRRWSLKSYFTFYRCLAQAIYGDASKSKDVIRVRDDYVQNNEAVIRRMKSLLQFSNFAEDSGTQQNAVQLGLAAIADAFEMRIKLYSFPDWCEVYDGPEIPLQLWADYTGLDCGTQQLTIRLVCQSNAFGVLRCDD